MKFYNFRQFSRLPISAIITGAFIFITQISCSINPESSITVTESRGQEGIWKSNMQWKAHWVKHWEIQKLWVPIWRKVWGPVQVKEWIPLPKPPPTWTPPLH